MSVYETELLSNRDVPNNYRFPEMPGVKNNNVVTQAGIPSPCSSVSMLRQVEWDVYAGAKDGMLATATPDTMTQIQHFYRPLGWKTYEMKDWLGTPRLTFSDIKQPDVVNNPYANYTYHLDYLSATTTYPFGARIDSLSFEKPSFRFGFTGHLKDNSIRPDKGDGANYSTLFREYDPIIGRWWSIDPLRAKYAGMSPYNYSGNNPINRYDPKGSTDYKVGTEGNHETTTIKDGNTDIDIYVSKKDLLKQQELWKKDDKLEYERNLDQLSYDEGFTAYEKYGALQYSLYHGILFIPGLEVTSYSPGSKRYSEYAIEKLSPLYPITKGNEELLESLDKFSSWLETSTNHNQFMKDNVFSNIRSFSRAMKGIQYTTDICKIYAAYYYKDRGFGYYFQRTSAGALGSFGLAKVGSTVYGSAATIVSAPMGAVAPAFIATSAAVGGAAGAEFGKELGYEAVDLFYDNWLK